MGQRTGTFTPEHPYSNQVTLVAKGNEKSRGPVLNQEFSHSCSAVTAHLVIIAGAFDSIVLYRLDRPVLPPRVCGVSTTY